MASMFGLRGGGHGDPIDLSDDEDIIANTALLSIEENDPIRKFMPPPEDEDDDEDGNTYCRELTPNEIQNLKARMARTTPPTPAEDRPRSVTTEMGFVVEPGVVIEFGPGDKDAGDFLLVDHICNQNTNLVVGTFFRRTRTANGMLPKNWNEVYALLKTYAGAPDPIIHEVPVTKSLDYVVATRDLILTNESFPFRSFRQGSKLYNSWKEVEENAVLVCRWKIVEFLDISKGVVVGSLVTMLREYECTPNKATSDIQRKRNWLGQVHKKTEHTYADICTGAGGMAVGAVMAGLVFAFALDHWDVACETLRLNWPDVKILLNDIFDLCSGTLLSLFVTILHISFPCQPHSLAHTVPGKNDDANIAAGYSVIPLLNLHRPRICTLEQSPGIKARGGWHFHALIHQFTTIEYSLRWQVLNLAEYGNVQARKRLIIIGACPGEILPPFPEPTHGHDPGQKRFTTIRDILSRIDVNNIERHMRAFTEKNGSPYNDNQPLRRCITTDGGESDLHPNGKRSFNLRELACLAGFPLWYKFSGTKTDIRKQIGNAVPSCFSKILFENIIKTLQESDEIDEQWEPEVISID